MTYFYPVPYLILLQLKIQLFPFEEKHLRISSQGNYVHNNHADHNNHVLWTFCNYCDFKLDDSSLVFTLKSTVAI